MGRENSIPPLLTPSEKKTVGRSKSRGKEHNEVRGAVGRGGNAIIRAQGKQWKILPSLTARFYLCSC